MEIMGSPAKSVMDRNKSLIKGLESATLVIVRGHMRVFPEAVFFLNIGRLSYDKKEK